MQKSHKKMPVRRPVRTDVAGRARARQAVTAACAVASGRGKEPPFSCGDRVTAIFGAGVPIDSRLEVLECVASARHASGWVVVAQEPRVGLRLTLCSSWFRAVKGD